MTISNLRPDVETRIREHDWPALRAVLAGVPEPEVADLLLELRAAEQVLLFRALPRDTAAEVFAILDREDRDELLLALTDEETRRLLADLPPDDRTELLAELPGEVTQRLINLLSPDDLRETRWLLGYPAESVGRLMTPDYVAVRPDWTVARALEHVRATARTSETVDVIYVIDERWQLLDDIELRRLVLAQPDATVAELMDRSYQAIGAAADQQEAVNMMRRYDLVALPVVDSDGLLLGIVTVDDVLDVAEEEATEDFHRVASVGPLHMSLREATIGLLYRKRIGWLMALVFMNIFSGAGIAAFEETIEAVVALVFFLPLLIDSGGNAGSQSATLMVRALATGDVRMKDWFRMLGREVPVALMVGLTMAGGVALISAFRAPEVVVVVALSMVSIVTLGSLIGMLLPFILTRFRRDPATASAPLITSLADISGVLIYFSIATWYLGIG
jgi:magnesium transporter